MAKKESNFKNMVLTLLIISFISSAALGFIFNITKEPIAKTLLEKKLNAIKKVVPAFNNDPNKEMYMVSIEDNSAQLEMYPAKQDSTLTGTAVKTFTNKGFSGLIELIVGFGNDGSIVDISVLNQKETPGLGTKMTEPFFKDQFKGKNLTTYKMKVKKDGGDVDAITAATISSRAFCDAVQRAYDTYQKGGKK
ncbi:MAG: RnfABCDGE type electron transport complex subunit G [Bacteroidetes bacterium GWA2_31_9]|nr:MAG: RnfABCDGE type electron transport complex subunit G [Bacteroidetes bacterium GWA2_31_9]